MPIAGRGRLGLNNKKIVPPVVHTGSIKTGLLLEFVLPPAIYTQHGFLKLLHFGLFFLRRGRSETASSRGYFRRSETF